MRHSTRRLWLTSFRGLALLLGGIGQRQINKRLWVFLEQSKQHFLLRLQKWRRWLLHWTIGVRPFRVLRSWSTFRRSFFHNFWQLRVCSLRRTWRPLEGERRYKDFHFQQGRKSKWWHRHTWPSVGSLGFRNTHRWLSYQSGLLSMLGFSFCSFPSKYWTRSRPSAWRNCISLRRIAWCLQGFAKRLTRSLRKPPIPLWA